MTGPQTPDSISSKLQRIATVARTHPGVPLRALAHHIDRPWLAAAFASLRTTAAAGIDGVSTAQYAQNLEDNLQSLLDRAKSGTYQAPPVRRVQIPKGDGRLRPLGIPTVEDKLLQQAVKMLLEPVYEQEFYSFSYGFRPGRSAHDAIDHLDQVLHRMGGGWVLDADIASFFEELDHAKLREILAQRVCDGTIVRLVGKWLRAGVLEGGIVHRRRQGTPQGGVISPLLANIYLHTVLDRWWVEEVLPRLSGEAHLIRYADDFVMVFANESDARRVREVLPQRFARFGLRLHPDKTRLLRFQKPMGSGGGSPETFEFLGFLHYWRRNRRGGWTVNRKTSGKSFGRSLQRVKEWVRRHRHRPIVEQARHLRRVLQGHYQYFGITGNSRALARFREEVRQVWRKWLSRRSQRGWMSWERFARLSHLFPLPLPRLASRYRTAKL